MREWHQTRETWDADTVEPISDFLDAGDRVVVRQVWHAVGQGPESNIELTNVFTVPKRLIIYQEFFWDHDEALETLGLTKVAMSRENLEMFRRAFEAYERGDLDAAVADIAPDCEYIAAGTVPGRIGTYRGPEGYKEFMAWLVEEFSDTHAKIDALIDAGDSVVLGATLRGQGRQSGIPATFTFWQVWRFADGKIVHGQGFAQKADALEAAGLRE